MIHPEVHNIAEALDVLSKLRMNLACGYPVAWAKVNRATRYLENEQGKLLAEVLNDEA